MDRQTNDQADGNGAAMSFDPGAVPCSEFQSKPRYKRDVAEVVIIDARPFPWSLEDYRTIVQGQLIGEPLPRLEERIQSLWKLGIPPENAVGALYDGRDD